VNSHSQVLSLPTRSKISQDTVLTAENSWYTKQLIEKEGRVGKSWAKHANLEIKYADRWPDNPIYSLQFYYPTTGFWPSALSEQCAWVYKYNDYTHITAFLFAFPQIQILLLFTHIMYVPKHYFQIWVYLFCILSRDYVINKNILTRISQHENFYYHRDFPLLVHFTKEGRDSNPRLPQCSFMHLTVYFDTLQTNSLYGLYVGKCQAAKLQ